MSAKKRIHWSEREEALVAEKACELFLSEKQNLWRYFLEGQKILAEDRRRNITGNQAISGRLIQRFVEARQEVLEGGDMLPIEIEKEVPIEVPREEVLKSITTDELLSLVAARLSGVLDMIPVVLERLGQNSNLHVHGKSQSSFEPEKNSTTNRKKKVRVLLCEFLPGQEDSIRKKAAELDLELRFRPKNDREKMPTSCNWCIVMRKLSHSASGRINKGFDSKRIFFVEGVNSTMKKLREIAEAKD